MANARIRSIDSLRAVTLLSIFLVHAAQMFGFHYTLENNFSYHTHLGLLCRSAVDSLLAGRCNIIFSILFGVSFYLILRNPANTSRKFVWRCFLLMLLGLCNKIFYTYDALMWYGLCGMILVLFRHFSVPKLFISFLVLFVLSLVLVRFHLGTLLFPETLAGRR